MKALRFIPLAIGWFIMGISLLIFCAATGIGWFGEQVVKLAFEGGLEK